MGLCIKPKENPEYNSKLDRCKLADNEPEKDYQYDQGYTGYLRKNEPDGDTSYSDVNSASNPTTPRKPLPTLPSKSQPTLPNGVGNSHGEQEFKNPFVWNVANTPSQKFPQFNTKNEIKIKAKVKSPDPAKEQGKSKKKREGPRYGISSHVIRTLKDGTVVRGKQGATFAGFIPYSRTDRQAPPSERAPAPSSDSLSPPPSSEFETSESSLESGSEYAQTTTEDDSAVMNSPKDAGVLAPKAITPEEEKI
ncbi:hypothetical protein E0Z10_g5926 [Xylaria hypoxylon]|uniref:Uncharacterized protein n=1 Tax=Xylaria hypoxylon TaxID=37992 RepID=A0A4Z0YHD5_9PEZI|nr:hypothetical protein E0Z10_g5926 [Xylaria hypoxylon]